MPARLISDNVSLAYLREETLFTRVRLGAHPLTAKLAVPYDELLTEWQKVAATEQALNDARTTASAQISVVDDAIDLLVGELAMVVLQRTDGDRQSDLYLRYFKKRPSEVRRPVLGRELTTVKGWLPSLVASADPELKRIGAALDEAVQDGEKAEAAWDAVTNQIADFRKLGARQALQDKLNRTRQGTYGELAQLPLTAGVTLPSDFASGFFRQRSETPPTLKSVQAAIAATEDTLAELRATLKSLQDEAAAEAQEKAEREAKQAELAAAQRVLADTQARIRALSAELGR